MTDSHGIDDYCGHPVQHDQYKGIKILENLVRTPIPIVSSIDKDNFGIVIEKTHIIELGLQNKNLTTLPENIGVFTAIKKLDLSLNELKVLPESIGNFASIKEINLRSNNLIIFPENVLLDSFLLGTCFLISTYV